MCKVQFYTKVCVVVLHDQCANLLTSQNGPESKGVHTWTTAALLTNHQQHIWPNWPIFIYLLYLPKNRKGAPTEPKLQ
jgi:hypothetical protein